MFPNPTATEMDVNKNWIPWPHCGRSCPFDESVTTSEVTPSDCRKAEGSGGEGGIRCVGLASAGIPMRIWPASGDGEVEKDERKITALLQGSKQK
uniref:Uncharacterized protein n=1 Tax=Bursaphelenchus xylophilus TaxID=6326 RepID=A0A1I7S7U4_BURXY